MNTIKKWSLLGCLLLVACGTELFAQKNKKQPINIILLIGDGMGLSQVSASQFFNDDPSNFERFQTIGLIKTSSATELITDSASAATSFATGIKTYNGAIGVDTLKVAATTIVEYASQKGILTGLIATSSIVHATPASFYAHVDSRKKYNDIALFLPTSAIDFFAGGGLKFFEQREDGIDVLTALQKNGFSTYTDSLPTKLSNKKTAILLADDEMPKIVDGRGSFLPDATKLALQQLSKNKEGFFLMVEGSQIDWGGHSNDAEYIISELIDFDTTIGVALDFAQNNKNTLVIVTADHETGGFTLSQKEKSYQEIEPTFSTGGHSATMIPVFAKGPGEEAFSGIYENTEIFYKMMKVLGLEKYINK